MPGVRPKTATTRACVAPPPMQYTPDSHAQTESGDTPAEWAQPMQSFQPRWAPHDVSVRGGPPVDTTSR